MIVREEVKEGEKDGRRLLHAQKAVERPFAMELKDRLKVWRIAREALVRYDVLAEIIAFRRAGPKEKTMLK